MSGLLIRLPCASLAVDFFNSYPALFIVKLLIASTRLSNLCSFLLVKIASAFSLYELDARLNAEAVKLLESVIDSSSSSITTFKIAYQIFAWDKCASLLSLKFFMVLLSSV